VNEDEKKTYAIYGKILQVDPKDLTVDMIAGLVEEAAPKVWKACYTKHIDNPGTHYGFKALAVTLASGIAEIEFSRRYTANIGGTAAVMQKWDYPTYYVAKPLLEALLQTHPPDDVTWGDLKYPFDGMAFMLPRNTIFEPNEGEELMLVGFSISRAGKGLIMPGTHMHIVPVQSDRITLFWSTRPGVTSQDCTFPLTQKLEPDATWIDAKTEEFREVTKFPLDAPSTDFTIYLAGIISNLLLLMEARGELVESGGATGKILKSGRPIHRATFIGRSFSVKRVKTDPTAKFTELRWRAGHMRRQHFGVGRGEVKTIWIEPYIALSAGLKKL
jgi:hypothetical protein